MFTGIVQEVGTIKSINEKAGEIRLIVSVRPPKFVKLGSSVAVSGVCLTVANMSDGQLEFDVMHETIKKTSLSDKHEGSLVNIEYSLRAGDEIGGHFVYGHVSHVAQVKSLKSKVKSRILTIVLPSKIASYIVPQGSVAIDGVSLTVASVSEDSFDVSLVDYTLEHTTLKDLKVVDMVNIEVDVLARYASKILNTKY